MGNLASMYRNQGRWKEAEQLEVQVMETSLRVLGNEHPDTLTRMANLAFTLKDKGLIRKAVSLIESCYKLRVLVLGSQHHDCILSYETLTTWSLEVTKLSEQNNS